MPFLVVGFRYVIYIYCIHMISYDVNSFPLSYLLRRMSPIVFFCEGGPPSRWLKDHSALAASRSGLILTSRQPLYVWPRGQKSKWLIYNIYTIIHESLELIEMNLLYISACIYFAPSDLAHYSIGTVAQIGIPSVGMSLPIILQDWSHCQRKVLSTGKGVKMWTLVRKGLQCYATCLKSLRPGNGWWTFVVSNICC